MVRMNDTSALIAGANISVIALSALRDSSSPVSGNGIVSNSLYYGCYYSHLKRKC